MSEDDHLAYGEYHGGEGNHGNERGILGDTVNRFRSEGVSSLLGKLSGAVQDISSDLTSRFSDLKVGAQSAVGNNAHRFGSFAQTREANDAKWYVDGCGYFWAVSEAIENAKESIWILDWWLSPELYLRRPPAQNGKYRLDRLLRAAAERGVKVNIIIYKEVPQALTLSSEYTKHTLEALHFNIAVFRHPDHLPDAQTLQSSLASSLSNFSLSTDSVAKLPLDAIKALYGAHEDVILFWAHHEKLCLIDGQVAFMGGLDLCYGRWDTNQHAISDVHPLLDDILYPGQDYNNARIMDFQNVSQPENNKLDRTESSRMGWSDISISLKGPVLADVELHFVQRWNFIYNLKYDVRRDHRYRPLILQGQHASSQHQGYSITGIAEQRPGFSPTVSLENVHGAEQSQVHDNSWSSHSATGRPFTHDTEGHFPPPPTHVQSEEQAFPLSAQQANPSQASEVPYFPPPPGTDSRGALDEPIGESGQSKSRGYGGSSQHDRLGKFEERGFAAAAKLHHAYDKYAQSAAGSRKSAQGSVSMQLVRSCAQWSNGGPREQSIQNAYISAIRSAQHFIYIENQFFITATSSKQAPVMNKIGAALVERIVRAARAGEKFKVVVVIPAVPGFAGDLRDESSLGTRAIMEFQYNSINRGGYSIMEEINAAGYNPMDYIRFYNLRNYDRINYNPKLQEMEQNCDMTYEDVRREADELLDPMGRKAQDGGEPVPASRDAYNRFQEIAGKTFSQDEGYWDTVSQCYMLHGPDIRTAKWNGDAESEINAYVSEELYIHSKVLIADDRLVICGSANLNDRSQLGDHDSEIAMVIEDSEVLDSYMGGAPWRAGKFAATLRRQLFRKHLGLLPPQQVSQPDGNFHPVGTPNEYDFGSPEDHLVQDPVAETFLDFWNSRAHRNTEAFRRLFHAIPDDTVRNWKDYHTFYEQYFHVADQEAQGKMEKKPPKYRWGHVVREEFPSGPEGVTQIKDTLSTIKGNLVEMPLTFLIEEDIAKQGLALNAVTEPIYT